MTEKNVIFHVVLKVDEDDVDLLLQSARELDGRGKQIQTVPEALRSLCVWPARSPAEVGYELNAGTCVTALPEPGIYQLLVDVTVRDVVGVMSEAEEVYREHWGDDEWTPDDLIEALAEILLGSNPNPSPGDLGFTIVRWGPLP